MHMSRFTASDRAAGCVRVQRRLLAGAPAGGALDLGGLVDARPAASACPA
jgi:hypothetical protein